MSTHTIPGLVDPHVHLRVPGGEHKEDVRTGTAAALAGGVTAVLAMPNTQPPIASSEGLSEARTVYGRDAYCDVGLFVGATADNAEEAAKAASCACGLKMYVDETYGTLRLGRLDDAQGHFRAWPRHKPIVLHAEGLAVAAAVGLAACYGRRVHIAHVSRRDEIQMIAAAKESGLPVTCEVTPHHLFLTEDDLPALGGPGDVRPRLATAADRDALWAHLEVVDCIATDHAPHARHEKEAAAPPPGVPGLETALPLMLTAVHDGRLTLDRLVTIMSANPASIFGVSTPAESAVELELGPPWTLPECGYQTKSDWSPFAGMTVRGRVRRTALRGRVAWDGGRLCVPPGYGRLIPP